MMSETTRASTIQQILIENYNITDENLVKTLSAVAESTFQISNLLRNHTDTGKAGSFNASGDDQLVLDLKCDEAVFTQLKKSGAVSYAVSEETPVVTECSLPACPTKYCVGFDPLDGSSIIDADFSVGSIFGIWPDATNYTIIADNQFIGRSGREQVAAALSVYGPRTVLCIALQQPKHVVFEVQLVENATQWVVTRPDIQIAPKGKIFAPGNLRASNDNVQYAKLIQKWIGDRYTLRYTGGMVPDVYHMFVKGKGVFSNVSSEKAKAKLRVVYEVAPIGLIVEMAGGSTVHESQNMSVLDILIQDLDQRCGVCFGSSQEVELFKNYMWSSDGNVVDDDVEEEKPKLLHS